MMDKKKQAFEQLFSTLDGRHEINGAVLAAENGRILYQGSFGTAELETNRMLNDRSVFELASVSKPFTALGIMKLEQQGELRYDDMIEQWLPDFPYPGITIRHLLHHTSGLPDYMELFLTHWDRDRIAVNQDVIDMLKQHKPDAYFPPGKGWLYSNTGYVVLAVMIEIVSGMSFAEFMQQAVFHPLRMNDTRVYNRRLSKENIPNYAYGYVYDVHSGEYVLPDELEETNYVVFLDGIQGDGTVNSTIGDLYLFDQALYTEEIISKETKDQAFTPGYWNEEEHFGYGFGWMIQNSSQKGKVVSHDGGWPGYSTLMIRYIDHNKTLIYLSNMEQPYQFEQAVIAAAVNILFDQPYEIPKRPADQKKADIDPAIYSRFIGDYSFQDDTHASVAVKENRLYLTIDGQTPFELFPMTETRYFVRALPLEIEFAGDKAQAASHFVLYQDGTEETALRID
ncbi:beta-lactamase family protein [Bacillus siamensis]|uniref:Penicillin-binding protein n=1 Tax=Bacillus siamensis TaxID=659243 RepID=A0AAI8HRE6_9BACI|nr:MULTISPECIES: serine hydrolase domain-containing protein [Bacillus]AME06241.1 penicillin-binding protein [Bacillus sp. SDLI1]AUJ78739.1 penicillin-binding protein [Bacillus siamensis]UUA84825.1 beta-lactamase family protein [Bacillus siamensis]